MSFEMSIDDGGVTAALAKAEATIGRDVRDVVVKGAVKVKETMRADVAKSKYFKAVGPISFDMSGNASYSEAAIGPEHHGGGDLANIAYFGGAHGGGGTVRDPQQALNEEAGPFENALSDLIKDL